MRETQVKGARKITKKKLSSRERIRDAVCTRPALMNKHNVPPSTATLQALEQRFTAFPNAPYTLVAIANRIVQSLFRLSG